MQTINLRKTCYCKSPLSKYNNPGGSTCRDCAISIANDDQHIYPCFNDQCFYRQISAQSYYICSQCYESADNDELIESTVKDFVYKKFCCSLNIMSLVISNLSSSFNVCNLNKHNNPTQYKRNMTKNS